MEIFYENVSDRFEKTRNQFNREETVVDIDDPYTSNIFAIKAVKNNSSFICRKIEKLVELRKTDPRCVRKTDENDHSRHEVIYVYYSCLAFIWGKGDGKRITKNLNKSFLAPLPRSEICEIMDEIDNHIENGRYKIHGSGGYSYFKAKAEMRLKLSPHEKKKIGWDEYEIRKREAKVRSTKRIDMDKTVTKLFYQNCSIREIARNACIGKGQVEDTVKRLHLKECRKLHIPIEDLDFERFQSYARVDRSIFPVKESSEFYGKYFEDFEEQTEELTLENEK